MAESAAPRRRSRRPTSEKPRIIIAQLDSSGTALTPYAISGILKFDEAKVAEVNGIDVVTPMKSKVSVS